MIIVCRFAQRSSDGLTKPDAGSHPRLTENSRIIMMPSQKLGVDNPHSAMKLAA